MKKIILIIILFLGMAGEVGAAELVGKLSYMTDQGVYGSVYDPDCPNNPVSVHVYHNYPSELNVICQSGDSCPWGESICPSTINHGKTGFWCLYRRPINSVTSLNKSQINVTALNACGSGNSVQLNGTSVSSNATITNYHYRENNTIFIDKPDYKVGISKRFGAVAVEFYNKRIDPSMNLIMPDPGAAFNSAIFGLGTGTSTDPGKIGTGINCVGTPDLRYNPTQSGSICPSGAANPYLISSAIESCTTETGANCMNIGTSYAGHSLKFGVRYRGFFYPKSLAPQYDWQSYDDVYGYITYTFENNYMQVDYQLWKTTPTTYGITEQLLPVVYIQQLTKYTYQKNGQIKTIDTTPNTYPDYAIDGADDSRWVTAIMSPGNPLNNGNYLTLAFYNKPFKGACPERRILMNYLPSDGNAQYSGAVLNALKFQPEMNNYIEFRALAFPYRYDQTIPGKGKIVNNLVGTYEANGGLMPNWECNMPIPTSVPPTATPTTKAAILGDYNGDKIVNLADFGFWKSKYLAGQMTLVEFGEWKREYLKN